MRSTVRRLTERLTMTESKWTDGPWMVWRNQEKDMRQGFSVDNQGGAKVAREVTTLENARLIAAAPDLAEACEAAAAALRRDMEHESMKESPVRFGLLATVNNLLDALRKAKGEA